MFLNELYISALKNNKKCFNYNIFAWRGENMFFFVFNVLILFLTLARDAVRDFRQGNEGWNVFFELWMRFYGANVAFTIIKLCISWVMFALRFYWGWKFCIYKNVTIARSEDHKGDQIKVFYTGDVCDVVWPLEDEGTLLDLQHMCLILKVWASLRCGR